MTMMCLVYTRGGVGLAVGVEAGMAALAHKVVCLKAKRNCMGR